MKNLIVQLKVYKGQVNFDKNGVLQSSAQLMKLKYGVREWTLFLKNIKLMGWTRVDVIKCLNGNKRIEENGMINHPEIDAPDYVKQEIDKAMEGEEKQLTPQEEIKELKAQMAQMVESKKDKPKKEEGKIEKVNVNVSDDELKEAKSEYEKLFDKKPHHKMGLDKIKSEIASKKTV